MLSAEIKHKALPEDLTESVGNGESLRSEKTHVTVAVNELETIEVEDVPEESIASGIPTSINILKSVSSSRLKNNRQ